MYFEARTHQLIEVSNALEAAIKIKTDTQDDQVIKWKSQNGLHYLYAVPDGHIDNAKMELAILRTELNTPEESFRKVESITNGWIDSVTELEKYLLQSETAEDLHPSGKYTNLIIGGPKPTNHSYMLCGCCGSGFTGNLLYQEKYGQDSGYGICPKCEKYYN